jgi:hypothetical protein
MWVKRETLLAHRTPSHTISKTSKTTKKGLKELEGVRQMIRELHHEVVEGEDPDPS